MTSGDPVVNLSIATSETWRDKASGEKKEKTEWHRVVIFGNLADIAEKYLKKGSKVYVSGSLQTRKWTDQSGQEKYTTEVVLQGFGGELTMLDGKGGGGGGGGGMSDDGPSGGGWEEDAGGNDFNSSFAGAGASRGGAGASAGGRPAAFDSDLDDDVPF